MFERIPSLYLLLQEGLENVPGGNEEIPPSPLPGWLPLVFIGAIFYLFLVRPESKRRKEQQDMLSSLSKGDRVLMSCGIYAVVVQVQGNDLTLQVADGVRVKAVLSAVQQRFVGDSESDSTDS
ncbi:MAG: preprotein translocase subunit YajC [Planctomycetota bacterium]|jgi:preprotein translocase subunit YajC